MTTGLVSQHQLSSYASPTSGQGGTASVVLGNDNTTVTGYNVHDADATIHVQSSTLANRPAAGTVDRKWMSYDTSGSAVRIFYDDGAAWREHNYIGTALTIASTSTAAVAVGPNGATNPVWLVDASVASQASGLKLTGSTATGSVALAVISSSTVSANLTIDALLAGTITLGATSTGSVNVARLLDISGASAGQIKFPSTPNASANVNTLDDYKEGSWVPTDASGAALSLTLSTCNYVKIGPVVFFWADITYPVTADGTAAKIGSLPYTVANVSSNRGGVVNFTDETTLKCFLPGNNTTNATLHDSVGAAVTNATMSGNRLIVSGMYQA